MERATLPTSLLAKGLTFRIYLPPCYDPGQRYPVLYLLHGQGSTEDEWIRLGAAAQADQLIDARQIPPLLIVFPYDANTGDPQATSFEKALLTVLIPYVDTQYATLPDRAHRAVGGLSRGAGWALHLGLADWQYFGLIGAHSLPIFRGDSAHLADWLDDIPPDSRPLIYMDSGVNDPELKNALAFEDLLTLKRVPHEWHLNQGYHNEDYWSAHVGQYLRWYTQTWPQP